MVEGARLESEYTPKAYRGFESHPLRHTVPALVSVFRAAREPRGFGGVKGPNPFPAWRYALSPSANWASSTRQSPRGSQSVRFPCFEAITGKNTKTRPQNRDSGGRDTHSLRQTRAFLRGSEPKNPIPCYSPEQGIYSTITGDLIVRNRVFDHHYRVLIASAKPSISRCFDQAFGRSWWIICSRLRLRGWCPARIACWISGARKASRRRRRS